MSYCVPLAAPFALEKKGLKHPSKTAQILYLCSSAVFIMDCNHLPKEVMILNQLPLLAIATCWAQRRTPWMAHFPEQLPTWILQRWRRFLGSSDLRKKGSLNWRIFYLKWKSWEDRVPESEIQHRSPPKIIDNWHPTGDI